MRSSTFACLLICFIWGPLLGGSDQVAADDTDTVTDHIVDLREAMGDAASEDHEAFKEAVRRVADKATKTTESKTCAKGCDLCPGDCSKCPVEGCASCSFAEGEEPLSCCTGKLPSRVGVNFPQQQIDSVFLQGAWPPQQQALMGSQSNQVRPNSSRPLYESAFSLEQIAHRLEMQNLLEEADTVRRAAVELRRSARKLPQE